MLLCSLELLTGVGMERHSANLLSMLYELSQVVIETTWSNLSRRTLYSWLISPPNSSISTKTSTTLVSWKPEGYSMLRPERSVANFLFERLLTCVQVVVDRDSAGLGLPGQREHVIDLDRDHRQICKLTNDSVFQRIVGHITRLVSLAEKRAMDERSEDRMQATEEQQPEHRLEVSVAASAPLLSTVNFSEPNTFVGHEALKLQLTQWLGGDSPSLVLHGPSGSGSV